MMLLRQFNNRVALSSCNRPDIEVLLCVYTATGQCVVERIKQLPGAEWTVNDALKRGIDQAERIAGGESGRLPCADAHVHDDD